ncbi:MAG: peptidase S8/S53 subtilisin kexin sedolisin [Sphingomonadales bacterium]|nr:MAG: peptidase S8/S53 subtilisin kexin sedolisin [Sphingomonadales bacterium]
MAAVEQQFIRDLLLGGRAGPRFLNESPIQLDVWYEFAANIDQPIDLILTPLDSVEAARLARLLFFVLRREPTEYRREITPMRGAVAVRLSFDDLVRVVLPLTGYDAGAALKDLANTLRTAYPPAHEIDPFARRPLAELLKEFAAQAGSRLSPELRLALLIAIIFVQARGEEATYNLFEREGGMGFGWFFSPTDPDWERPMVWRVSRNRPVETLGMSVETIKADAARRVFDVDCRELTWAVIDSGIDGSHPAFRDHDGDEFAIRVDRAYDFARMRALTAFDTLLDHERLNETVEEVSIKLMISMGEARAWLERLRDDAEAGRPYDWQALSRLLEVPVDRLPTDGDEKANGHGTHVAGVLAGDWREGDQIVYRGVCPNLRLYDLRVLDATTTGTEFAIIAALEFVRWINGRNRFMVVHGVNLSIGLLHDMDNYACGRTPVCLACETTIKTGVSVIAAAGNWGAQTYMTANNNEYRGYAAISIADPGNAELVITVGATHRERPHEYGVSFFSSRGPTGDGRLKPDVVAPGEKIDGPLPNLGFGRLDGTSMAAPHVSGVAAMLMARHPELIGKPEDVKKTIMASATDLGRERHFQGAGLVDALRALQAR